VKPDSNGFLTTLILVTFVCGLFILASLLRIKNSWEILHTGNISKTRRVFEKLDLVFSGILFIFSLIFYSIFILNPGR